MSSGLIVAHEFKLNEPANVILEFLNSDNRFKVHFIKNETGCVFMPTKTKRVKKNKAVQNNRPHFISHIAESELQAIAEVDFNQPGVYNWSKKITPSVADKKGVNPLVRITILYINNFYNSIY
jgi:signal recognition particle subunit SEC65